MTARSLPQHTITPAEVARILEAGDLVVLPTDTVYGLLARASAPEISERVYEAKGRPADKRLPFLLADPSDIATFVNSVPPVATRLMERFWPGPLTLVVGDPPGVAVRVPDHDFTRAVLRACSGPVFGTSANLSGFLPLEDADAIVRDLGDHVALVVDGGHVAGSASMVVRLHPDGTRRVLRDGPLDHRLLREALALRVLIVCTGNTCRSPMAEHLLRASAKRRLGEAPTIPLEVASAGISAYDGDPISAQAQGFLLTVGLDGESHRSRSVTEAMIDDADVIFALTEGHRRRLLDLVPSAAARCVLLRPDGTDVADPFGGDALEYARAGDQIRDALEHRLDELLPLITEEAT